MVEKLIEKLRDGNGTLAVLHEGNIHVYGDECGADALEWVAREQPERLFHAKVAARAVDFASANLLVESGVDEVFAKKITHDALRLLQDAGIVGDYHLVQEEVRLA